MRQPQHLLQDLNSLPFFKRGQPDVLPQMIVQAIRALVPARPSALPWQDGAQKQRREDRPQAVPRLKLFQRCTEALIFVIRNCRHRITSAGAESASGPPY